MGEAMWFAIEVGVATAIFAAAVLHLLLYVIAVHIVRAFPGTTWPGTRPRPKRIDFSLCVLCALCGRQALAMTPVEAIRAAAADLDNLPTELRPHQRYLWLPQPSDDKRIAMLYAVNAALAHSPVSVGAGRGVWIFAGGELMRCDLHVLAQHADYDRLVAVWESLATRDPYFHILSSRSRTAPTKADVDAQASVTKPPIVEAQVAAPVAVPDRASKTPAGRLRPDSTLGAAMRRANAAAPTATPATEPTAAPAPQPTPEPAQPAPETASEKLPLAEYLPEDAWSALRAGTDSEAPLVRGDWLFELGITSADQGLYPQFRGMKGLDGAALSQQEYFAARGIDLRLSQRLRSDERAALIRSQITGKPRRMRFVRGVGVRPTAGTGLCSITDDPFDADVVDPDFDPIRNLLVFQSRGSEVILELPNGWHEFSLWDANGRLVDEAPPQLATDHKIPSPHSARLQYPISCVRCHASEDGWRKVESDVPKLLARGGDIFGDFAARAHHPGDAEVLARLAGLYSGDIEEPLQAARDSYQDVVLRITGKGIIETSAAVAKVYADYVWQMVTPELAAAELGVPKFDAVPKQEPEDSTLLALQLGLPVNRRQWEFSYVEAATRLANAPAPVAPAENNPAAEAAGGDDDLAPEENGADK